MNEKLARRAAIKYRDWLLSQIQSPIASSSMFVFDNLYRANRKMAQIEAWAKRFFAGSTQRIQRSNWENFPHMGIVCPSVYEKIATTMIPELWEDTSTTMEHTVATLKSLVTREIITLISPKEATEELLTISDAWSEVKFENNVLSVLVKDIILSDHDDEVNLGSFWIRVNLTSPLDSLRVRSVDHVLSTGGYTHPHINEERLCIGEGGLLSQDALCQGRLEDYFRIIEAVLRTYNADSPYVPLREWYNPNNEDKFLCEGCEEWRDNEDLCYCEGCHSTYCNYCEGGGWCCIECGDWYCNECIIECCDCKEYICSMCANRCCGCSFLMCSSCLNPCMVCGNRCCNSCTSDCAYCGDSSCKNCQTTCGCCGDNCCETCVNETCMECNQNICGGCQTVCDECGKIICTTCNNECENCGLSMCKSCKIEHNCFLKEDKSSN